MNWLRAFLNFAGRTKQATANEEDQARVTPGDFSATDHPDFIDLKSSLHRQLALVPTLIDRTPQHDALMKRIDQICDQPSPRPLLVVLQGVMDDLHDHFVMRFGEIHLPERAGPARYLGRLKWSAGANGIDGLVSNLGEALSLSTTAPNDVWQYIAKERLSLCFSHKIDAEKWDDEHQRQCLAWIKKFTNDVPVLAEGQIVVAFLCLMRRDVDDMAVKKIIGEMQSAAGANPAVLITEPFGQITYDEVDEWVQGEVVRRIDRPHKVKISIPLGELAQETFEKASYKALTMRALHRPISDELKKIMPAKEVFSER